MNRNYSASWGARASRPHPSASRRRNFPLHLNSYYESKEEGLGARFRAEVSHVIKRILADPYLWRERAGGYRRVNCPVFPYYVAYFIRKETVLIAAVAHGHRRPGYWKERTIDA